jgi:hypothetical protein
MHTKKPPACFQSCKGFLHGLSLVHDLPASLQQNILIAKTKWSHKLITTFSLQLIFCRCLAVAINLSLMQKKNLATTMGIKQGIEDSLDKFEITKIDCRPTNEDMNQLTRELGTMLATIPTTNSGGDHGHIESSLTKWSTPCSLPVPPLSLYPRIQGHSQLTSVPMKWTSCNKSLNTNNSSSSTKLSKDVYRPQEQK